MNTLKTGFVALLLAACSHWPVAERNQENARLHLQVSVERFSAREFNAALDSCQKALAQYPNYPDAYNQLALIYMETKRYEQSKEAFDKALTLKPKNPEVFNNMGVMLNRQERFREAITSFQKALEDTTYATPENALTNMGYSYFRLGQLSTARAYHQKALDIVPNFCLAAKNLGDTYLKEKNYAPAEKHFRKAARNCPLYDEARYKLGLVLIRVGEKSLAKVEFGKLLRQSREGPFVEKTQEVMRYLQ